MSKGSEKSASDRLVQVPEWQHALDRLERSLREAAADVVLLRQSLQSDGQAGYEAPPPEPSPPVPAPEATPPASASEPTPITPESEPEASSEPTPITPKPFVAKGESGRLAAFDRLWDRVEEEKLEKESGKEPEAAEPERRGLESLPQHYLMTVEDRETKVDLVPLHRSLASLPGMEEVSLVSYANGVAVVSLRLEGELSLEQLGEVVATAMDRECEVIPQDKTKIYLRLKASER